MQEFFMDYGLWLLIALLIVIGVVFLLGGRRKGSDVPSTQAPVAVERKETAPVAPVAIEPVGVAEPVIPTPAESTPAVAPAAAPIPISPAVASPRQAQDDLLKLKGVGPKLNQLLIELGVSSYAQIAGWSDADVAAIDARLGNFKGRPVRDQWIDQAKYLAAGDTAGFEAKYGKL